MEFFCEVMIIMLLFGHEDNTLYDFFSFLLCYIPTLWFCLFDLTELSYLIKTDVDSVSNLVFINL